MEEFKGRDNVPEIEERGERNKRKKAGGKRGVREKLLTNSVKY